MAHDETTTGDRMKRAWSSETSFDTSNGNGQRPTHSDYPKTSRPSRARRYQRPTRARRPASRAHDAALACRWRTCVLQPPRPCERSRAEGRALARASGSAEGLGREANRAFERAAETPWPPAAPLASPGPPGPRAGPPAASSARRGPRGEQRPPRARAAPPPSTRLAAAKGQLAEH